ncbi:MAG: hypothetical protein J5I81_04130 [Nitrococcus mobilis]|nr:hypothetical protein [Nitrococcus mobilis]
MQRMHLAACPPCYRRPRQWGLLSFLLRMIRGVPRALHRVVLTARYFGPCTLQVACIRGGAEPPAGAVAMRDGTQAGLVLIDAIQPPVALQ